MTRTQLVRMVIGLGIPNPQVDSIQLEWNSPFFLPYRFGGGRGIGQPIIVSLNWVKEVRVFFDLRESVN